MVFKLRTVARKLKIVEYFNFRLLAIFSRKDFKFDIRCIASYTTYHNDILCNFGI